MPKPILRPTDRISRCPYCGAACSDEAGSTLHCGECGAVWKKK